MFNVLEFPAPCTDYHYARNFVDFLSCPVVPPSVRICVQDFTSAFRFIMILHVADVLTGPRLEAIPTRNR